MNAARRCLWILSSLLPMLAGCAHVIDFMPKEIQDAEQPSIDGARRFEAEHPEASRSYSVNGRTIHYVEIGRETPARPLVIRAGPAFSNTA